LLCVILYGGVCAEIAQTLPTQDRYVDQFRGYTVVRADVRSQEQLDALRNYNMDVWSDDSTLHLGINDIMVSSDEVEIIRALDVEYEIMIEDVAAAISNERELNNNLRSLNDTWFTAYHPIAEINEFLVTFAKTNSDLVTLVPSAGKTIEGRDIPILVISVSNSNKPKILLLGGQHAREWIGPATVLYIANKLATTYKIDPVVTALLNKFDFVIVPVLNQDGYAYTWTGDRLWRKNRRHNTGGSYGVDLNRNWGFHWCESGASRIPSSDTYCGTGPASEPETQTIQNATLKYGPFAGAIDFHSYGQLIMRPYGYSSTPPPNDAELERVGDGMKDVMKAATGVVYTNQAIWQLYLSAGSSADWWTAVGKIPLSYGFEARDTGQYGFLLPADQIKPSGEENFAAVNYLASQVPLLN